MTTPADRQLFDPPAENKTFTVVGGYENYAAGLRVMELCKRLSRQTDLTEAMEIKLWKFEPLGLPVLRDQAAREAAGADMIIIADRGDWLLPREALAWIELWSRDLRRASPGRSRVLVYLPEIVVDTPHAFSTRDYLQMLAAECGFDFLTPTRSSASGDFPEGPDPILDRDRFVDHFGINE